MSFAEPTHFTQAALAVDNVLAHVTDDQWSASTPCIQWTVADVTEHLIDVNQSFATKLRPEDGIAWTAHTGSPSGELLAQYRCSTEQLRHALVCATQPGGQLPTSLRIRLALRVADLLIHGWDIATSTGGCLRIDDHLVDEVLVFADSRLAALQRGGQFAAPQPISSDAPAIERLAALSGRTRTSTPAQGE
ncbi:TIGR03086 family protein [Mycobacterium sp. TKK-01-0059]|uniref:TIGR03086 family metal-binding protein n=1 Tax=Mycobacterium sp. TKK-01-0059 TaxID=1324269 RepID=UPI0004D68D28|nr:TIGR03086 family metal-binding protein [Mycobacterium sp. TKK-01-0059]KEF94882.1 TIGR03086 family protein [Mycobacterium sp. TKK-01-0059]